MSEAVIEPTPEWTLDRGWKAAITEGGRYIFVCGLATSIATFMSGVLPLTIPFMIPTVAIGTVGVTVCHAYFANKYMLRPAYRRLNPSAQAIYSLGSRIAFANLIVMVYSPATLFSVLISPMTFAIFVTVQKRVLDIQMLRQDKDLPLTLFERFAIGGLLVLSMLVFTGLLLLAAVLGLV